MGDEEGAKVALFASMSDTDSTFDFLFALLMDTAVSALAPRRSRRTAARCPRPCTPVTTSSPTSDAYPTMADHRRHPQPEHRRLDDRPVSRSWRDLRRQRRDHRERLRHAALPGRQGGPDQEISKMAGKQTVASETQSDSRGTAGPEPSNRGISERDLIQPGRGGAHAVRGRAHIREGACRSADGSTGSRAPPRARACSRNRRQGRSTSQYRGRKEGNCDGADGGAGFLAAGAETARNIVNRSKKGGSMLATSSSSCRAAVTFLGGFLVVWERSCSAWPSGSSRRPADRDRHIHRAGGAIIIAASVYFERLDTSWLPA